MTDCVVFFRGQLLPKQPELLHVFKQRRVEEKKRADEQMREENKLEQILARQRQKIDQVSLYRMQADFVMFSFFLDGKSLFNVE